MPVSDSFRMVKSTFYAIDKTHDFVLFVFRPFFDPRSSVENVSNHVDTLVSYDFDG